MGFIRVADPLSSLRKETVLNPKVFIQEIQTGIEDFKAILRELVIKIQQVNDKRIKYMGADFRIMSSPIKGFMTDEFKQTMRSAYDRGCVSKKLFTEIVCEASYEHELEERKIESTRGDDYFMYPPVIANVEQLGLEYPGNPPAVPNGGKAPVAPKDGVGIQSQPPNSSPTGKVGKTQDKVGPEAKNFNKASLVKSSIFSASAADSPYSTIADMPDNIKDALKTPKKQKMWLKAFNNSYHFYKGKFDDHDKALKLAAKMAWATAKATV
jgi:cation transport regulator ChaB/predicted SprT family Zn-dependent metalloprotease